MPRGAEIAVPSCIEVALQERRRESAAEEGDGDGDLDRDADGDGETETEAEAEGSRLPAASLFFVEPCREGTGVLSFAEAARDCRLAGR